MSRSGEGVDREIETSYEELYQHAPCGHLSTTIEGDIVRVNDTLLSWTGYQRTDLVGRAFVSFLQPGSQLVFETRYRAVLHLRGAAEQVALSLRTAGGKPLPILINGTVALDEDGRPSAIRAAVFDARQRQEYERELLSARRLAEASEVRVRVLQRASSTFAAVTTDTALAERLVDSTREAFAASQVSVYLLGAADALHLAAGEPALGSATALDGRLDEALTGDLEEPVVRQADTVPNSSTLARAMRSARIETVTTVSIREGTTLFGLLVSSFRRTRTIDETDLELLEALALQAAHVLTRIRLQRQLEHLALYDQLTGLASRRLMHSIITEAVAPSRTQEQSVALIFVDLDGFKAINDELGHAAGDAVLREIGSRLSSAVRHGDAVGRFGGDEFIVFCTDVGPETVDRVVERLHAAIRAPLPGLEHAARVTCSIGVALCTSGAGASPEGLFERADAAMYESKRAGKNRTTIVDVSSGAS